MKVGAKDIFRMLKASARDFSDDECPRLAAALSYFTVFSLPPLLILILLIVGLVMDPQDARAALAGNMGNVLGPEGAKEIETIIQNAKNPGASRGLTAVLGLGALLFGATGAFMQLQAALNRAWEVEPDKTQGGLKNFVLKRLLSLGMVLTIAFLLLVSLALSSVITAAGEQVDQVAGEGSSVIAAILTPIITFVVVTFLFALIFKVLPDARIAWKDALVGAVATAALFTIGKELLGLYLGRSNPGQAFGAAGSLALLLVWIYYSAMILLFGAEFTQAWATDVGGGIEPEEGARRMSDETGRELIPQAKERKAG